MSSMHVKTDNLIIEEQGFIPIMERAIPEANIEN